MQPAGKCSGRVELAGAGVGRARRAAVHAGGEVPKFLLPLSNFAGTTTSLTLR